MKLTEDIKPVTFMKTHSADLLKIVNQNHRPVVITQNGEARAVVQDIATYEKQKETFMLLKIVAQGEKEIASQNYIKQDQLFQKLDKKLEL